MVLVTYLIGPKIDQSQHPWSISSNMDDRLVKKFKKNNENI